jgi:uncharacterized membrane protein
MKRAWLAIVVLIVLTVPSAVYGQEQGVEQDYLEKAKVLEASTSRTEEIPGTELSAQVQELTIQVLEGAEKGMVASFRNDFTQVKPGDVIYVRHTVGGFDPERWSVADPYRLDVLIIVAVGVLILLLIFGGLQGIRGLASLLGSLVLIFYLLLPSIYSGFSPILVSIGVAALIIIVGSYITHGFNRTTTTAMVGMIITVIVTGFATYLAIHAAHLSGFTTEENVYLNFNTAGRIDLIGLLFGGIMIGLLGVLYDIAIGQAVAVEELIAAGKHYTRSQIYTRAMRIGREHIGALVNTLAIAYVGASLPLLLLLQQAQTSMGYLINSEIFATEILRILMGTGGLVLAVPITTFLASHALYGRFDAGTSSSPSHPH